MRADTTAARVRTLTMGTGALERALSRAQRGGRPFAGFVPDDAEILDVTVSETYGRDWEVRVTVAHPAFPAADWPPPETWID